MPISSGPRLQVEITPDEEESADIRLGEGARLDMVYLLVDFDVRVSRSSGEVNFRTALAEWLIAFRGLLSASAQGNPVVRNDLLLLSGERFRAKASSTGVEADVWSPAENAWNTLTLSRAEAEALNAALTDAIRRRLASRGLDPSKVIDL